jgi:hypothetical protein
MKILLPFFVLVSFSLQAQWTILGDPGFSNRAASLLNMEIDKQGTPFVAFQGIYGKLTVMQYEIAAWDTVGARSISEGGAYSIDLKFDNENSPYVVFRDYSEDNKLTALKFLNDEWVQVGQQGFTEDFASYPAIAFDPISNSPYVAYRDKNKNFRCSVQKFNGTSWEYVGDQGFSDLGSGWQGAADINLAFTSDGVPYVSFLDCSNNWRPSVLKFNGSSWEYLGTSGFTPGESGSPSLLIDHNNEVYLAFADLSVGMKMSVMKYDGSNWNYVGSAGFSFGPSAYASLQCDAANNLFVSYKDQSLGSRATVKYFNGTSWEYLGDSLVSDSDVLYPSLAIDDLGTAYLAYQEAPNYFATMKRYLHAGAVGIKEEAEKESSILLQPNPTDGKFTIRCDDIFFSDAVLKVSDPLGRQIFSKNFTEMDCGIKEFDLSGYPKGVYFVELRSQNFLHSAKVVLQ